MNAIQLSPTQKCCNILSDTEQKQLKHLTGKSSKTQSEKEPGMLHPFQLCQPDAIMRPENVIVLVSC